MEFDALWSEGCFTNQNESLLSAKRSDADVILRSLLRGEFVPGGFAVFMSVYKNDDVALFRRAADLGISNRVFFTEDSECDLAEEIPSSIAVLSPSATEVLPLTLIEAMTSGSPFVATPVGAVPLFRGGLHAQDVDGLRKVFQLMIDIPELWQQCSENGRRQHAERYTLAHVETQLHTAIEAAMRGGIGDVERSIALTAADTARPRLERGIGQ